MWPIYAVLTRFGDPNVDGSQGQSSVRSLIDDNRRAHQLAPFVRQNPGSLSVFGDCSPVVAHRMYDSLCKID
jgi:hypothetical protein